MERRYKKVTTVVGLRRTFAGADWEMIGAFF